MVFEGYVYNILERLVGKYLDGLDKKNLKIGVSIDISYYDSLCLAMRI
jgi:hypothetical protein